MANRRIGIKWIKSIPVLEVLIDGKTIRMAPDNQKWALTERDIIFLGPQFEDMTTEIVLEPDEEAGRATPLTLRGYVQDKQLAGWFRDFIETINGPPNA